MSNILTLLQLCPVMESKIHLSDMYIKLEMWSEAETLLDSIESADDGYLSYTRIQKELLPAYTENGGIKTQAENTDLMDLLAHVGHTAKGKGKLTALDHIISEHPPCPEAMRLFIPEEIPPGERRGLVPVKAQELYPEALYVYPNPSDGKLNIRLQSEETTPAKLIIRDIQGKTVYQENGLSPNREYNISTLTLPPGVYFMDVNNGRQTWQKKWVKN